MEIGNNISNFITFITYLYHLNNYIHILHTTVTTILDLFSIVCDIEILFIYNQWNKWGFVAWKRTDTFLNKLTQNKYVSDHKWFFTNIRNEADKMYPNVLKF